MIHIGFDIFSIFRSENTERMFKFRFLSLSCILTAKDQRIISPNLK